MEKCVTLQHPKNNLFTLKKLILIENRKSQVVRLATFFVCVYEGMCGEVEKGVWKGANRNVRKIVGRETETASFGSLRSRR